MTTTTAEPDQIPEDLSQLVLNLPAKRWFMYRRRLDMPTTEILEDLVAQLVVGAHERWMKSPESKGREDVARFMEMGIEELKAAAGIVDAPEEAPEGDPKSEVAAGVQPADAGADAAAGSASGGDEGVPGGAGAVVPRDHPVDR